MIDTTPHPSGNEDPDAVSTATEGGNEPLSEAELGVIAKLLKGTRPAPFVKPSKHRAGRQPKMTGDQRHRRGNFNRRVVQARKKVWLEHQADARALMAAIDRD